MKINKWIYLLITVFILFTLYFTITKKYYLDYQLKIGTPIDSLNGIKVYYNGDIGNVNGRNKTEDGYNLGLKYQCVEFVKRYYYKHLKHKMPNSWGHAKDFFDTSVPDGKINKSRGLVQYTNPSTSKPKINDIIVFSGTIFNKYGHVAIVSKVNNEEIEVIQQNVGSSTRENYTLEYKNEKWKIKNERVLGWLRKN